MQVHYGLICNKIVTSRFINRCKNLRHKILNCNRNIYFNKRYLEDNLTPKFANIKIMNTYFGSKFTQQKYNRIRVKSKLNFRISENIN